MNATSAATETRLAWLDWLRRELAPSHDRQARTLILVCGAALCVIISMTLQVPQLAVSAYMVFFISKESKTITTLVGVLGLIGLTIGIALSLLLYKVTYGHAELRIPSMAIILLFGMYASRVLVIGPLGFILSFVLAVTQSLGDLLPSPELLVRASLWLWVALAYAIGLTVILNRLFLSNSAGPARHLPKPKSLFVPNAFTNPAHIQFALKVTFAAMFCYLLYTAVDWDGIHTAFITCVFISLESTGATLRKGVLRIAGCIIGGLVGLFTIIFLIPHMETIASLVILVACVSAIAGWVATGTERIAYAGLQIAFAFFYSIFPGFNGYAPDIDLHNVRNRVVGILLGSLVTTVVFHYIWPERAIDRLRDSLRRALRQLAHLLVIPRPEIPEEQAKSTAEALLTNLSREIEQSHREAELVSFEMDGAPLGKNLSPNELKNILSHVERILATLTSLNSEAAFKEWQQLPPEAQLTETELRRALSRRIEHAVQGDSSQNPNAELSRVFAQWTEISKPRSFEGSRIALISRIAIEVQQLGSVHIH